VQTLTLLCADSKFENEMSFRKRFSSKVISENMASNDTQVMAHGIFSPIVTRTLFLADDAPLLLLDRCGLATDSLYCSSILLRLARGHLLLTLTSSNRPEEEHAILGGAPQGLNVRQRPTARTQWKHW